MRDTLPPFNIGTERKNLRDTIPAGRQTVRQAEYIMDAFGTGIVGKIHPQPTCKNTVESSRDDGNQYAPLSVLYSSAYRTHTQKITKFCHKCWIIQNLEHLRVLCHTLTSDAYTHTRTRDACTQGASVRRRARRSAHVFNLPVKKSIIKNMSKMGKINNIKIYSLRIYFKNINILQIPKNVL